MHETDDAYSMQSTWSCYWLDQFLTLALNILILSIFYISMDLSTNYFAHFSGCSAFFVCSCHSNLECCVTFSGVKLSIRSFVLFSAYRNGGKENGGSGDGRVHIFLTCHIESKLIFNPKGTGGAREVFG